MSKNLSDSTILFGAKFWWKRPETNEAEGVTHGLHQQQGELLCLGAVAGNTCLAMDPKIFPKKNLRPTTENQDSKSCAAGNLNLHFGRILFWDVFEEMDHDGSLFERGGGLKKKHPRRLFLKMFWKSSWRDFVFGPKKTKPVWRVAFFGGEEACFCGFQKRHAISFPGEQNIGHLWDWHSASSPPQRFTFSSERFTHQGLERWAVKKTFQWNNCLMTGSLYWEIS